MPVFLDSIIFCTIDFAALVIQALGGGIASSANTDSGSKLGADIMLVGIIIQLGTWLLYDRIKSVILMGFGNGSLNFRV